MRRDSLKALCIIAGLISLASYGEPILPSVLIASASKTSLPLTRSYFIVSMQLKNKLKSVFSFSIMPIAMYPVVFSLNLDWLINEIASVWPKSIL